jgi:hypothetical protein
MFDRLIRLLLISEQSKDDEATLCEKLDRHIDRRAQEPRLSRNQTQIGMPAAPWVGP